MYEPHFGLHKKPFQITTDPNFLWMGKKHREALTTLKYGVMDNKGFLLLTGDVGTGKTTLINRLVEDIKDKVYTAKIPDPRLSKYDFYRMVSKYFKLPIEVRTKSDFIGPFTRFLSDAHHEKKSVLLLIDEVQRLKHDLLEEIRLLSNLERQDAKLLNIFFVGQNEFNSILLQPENRALMRRITVTHNLDPLNLSETGEFVRHRLKVAGASDEIFSAGAVEEVYDFSNGFPRQINIICDLAMFFASQMDQHTISRKIVRQCRERISFNIAEPPAAVQKHVPGPAETLPPTRSEPPRRSPPSRLWMAVGVAIGLVCAAATYYGAPQWKPRVRQFIQTIIQSEQKPQPVRVEPPPPDMDATVSDDSAGEAAPLSVGTANPPSTPLSDSPIRPSEQLHAEDAGETGAGASEIQSAFNEDRQPSMIPPSAGDPAAIASTPDPADAVEWVLKKRHLEKGR